MVCHSNTHDQDDGSKPLVPYGQLVIYHISKIKKMALLLLCVVRHSIFGCYISCNVTKF